MTSTEQVQALLREDMARQGLTYRELGNRAQIDAPSLWVAMNTSPNLQLATIDKITKGLNRTLVFRLTKEET